MDTTKLDAAIEAADNADPTAVFARAAPTECVRAWPDGLPQPGIYPDVPYEQYRSWPAVNGSALKILHSVTPKHAKAYMDGLLDRDTPDRLKGRALHCSLLEPTAFSERFPMAGLCPEPLASGKRKGEPCGNQGAYRDSESGARYCGTHAKAHPDAQSLDNVLSIEQHESLALMRKEVFAHAVAKMLRAHGGTEVSLVWSQDGIAAKARLDKYIPGPTCPRTILDLKKIQSMAGTERALQTAIRNYGYDLSAAWYKAGIVALHPGGPPPNFIWLFAEDAAPFDVRAVMASKAMMTVGEIKMRRAFELYKWCLDSGKWPGYSDDLDWISPDDYELKRFGLEG